MPELLSRLDEVKTTIPIANADVFLPALFDVAEHLQDTMGFSEQMPFISAWRTASWYLKSETDQAKRGEIFLRALANSTGLGVPATLIGLDIDRRSKEPMVEYHCNVEDHGLYVPPGRVLRARPGKPALRLIDGSKPAD